MKLEKTIPSHKKSVEFYAIKKDFSNYTEGWRRIRSKMHKKLDSCEWCSTPFQDGDCIALGFSRTHRNMVLCQGCAASALRTPEPPQGEAGA